MREIKFRAWDKEGGEWFNPGCFCILGTGTEQVIEHPDDYRNEMLSDIRRVLDNWDQGFDLGFIDFTNWYATDGLIIEQFTGLHDKNGKDIYEGDIIAGENGSYPAQVFWCEGGARFTVDQSGEVNMYDLVVDQWYVVIGNIHENPDLIK